MKTLSVSELSFYITSIFEAEELLHDIKVYGEVSNLSNVRGNLYFNLKDETALVPCILFGASANAVHEGDQVLCNGTMKYYAKGGKLNFYVTSLMPYGSGLLFQKFNELKQKLDDEGIFGKEYKKELPPVIKKIGVITSQTGAVLHDIQNVAFRRNPTIEIVVFPARVQGNGAEKTIIDGLKYFDKCEDIDCIIIARGGGSIEDLQPFNTEVLAREIVKNSKPVISAVGHETDFTICDFASSLRASTPSVAAELVSKNLFDEVSNIKNSVKRMLFLILNNIDLYQAKFEKNLDRLISNQKNILELNKKIFLNNIKKLLYLFDNVMSIPENNLILNKNYLLALNPKNIAKNGWAKVRKSGNAIRGARDICVGDDFVVEFADGLIESKAVAKHEKESI